MVKKKKKWKFSYSSFFDKIGFEMMFGDIHEKGMKTILCKTSFLQSRHNGFPVKESTDDFRQK